MNYLNDNIWHSIEFNVHNLTCKLMMLIYQFMSLFLALPH